MAGQTDGHAHMAYYRSALENGLGKSRFPSPNAKYFVYTYLPRCNGGARSKDFEPFEYHPLNRCVFDRESRLIFDTLALVAKGFLHTNFTLLAAWGVRRLHKSGFTRHNLFRL